MQYLYYMDLYRFYRHYRHYHYQSLWNEAGTIALLSEIFLSGIDKINQGLISEFHEINVNDHVSW